jgi:hypothetical protein
MVDARDLSESTGHQLTDQRFAKQQVVGEAGFPNLPSQERQPLPLKVATETRLIEFGVRTKLGFASFRGYTAA